MAKAGRHAIVIGCTFARAYGLQMPNSHQRKLPTLEEIRSARKGLFGDHNNDAMNALFEPSSSEQLDPLELNEIEWENLPSDFPRGTFMRLGPNPQPGHSCPSFLDGDGMIHAVTLPPVGSACKPTYSRSYVRAKGFSAEALQGGKQLFSGTLVAPRGWPMLAALTNNALSGGGLIQKDTANTALSWHGGRLLALMEQSRPSELRATRQGRISTVRAGSDLGGAVPSAPITGGALSAHCRVDASTGERISVSYSTATPPYARVDVFASDGSLRYSRGVDTPSPVMVHDCAITSPREGRGHIIILDLPMTVRVERTLLDKFPVEYEPSNGARLGFVRRPSLASATQEIDNDPVIWVDVDPCVVLHTCNAHVAGDNADEEAATTRVVLTGLRSEPSGPQSFICDYTPAFLYEWVVDLEGSIGRLVSERYLSNVPCEFPAINPAFHGRPARSAYFVAPASAGGPLGHGYLTPKQAIVIDRLMKLDLGTGATLGEWRAPRGMYIVSEPTFVARDYGGEEEQTDSGARVDEDDGYVVVIVSQVPEGSKHRTPRSSRLLVFDARRIGPSGPVAELSLPADMPYGLHSCFVPWEGLVEG